MCFGQILPSQTVAHGPLPVSTTLVRGFTFGRETIFNHTANRAETEFCDRAVTQLYSSLRYNASRPVIPSHTPSGIPSSNRNRGGPRISFRT
jgi:hypothetical protein